MTTEDPPIKNSVLVKMFCRWLEVETQRKKTERERAALIGEFRKYGISEEELNDMYADCGDIDENPAAVALGRLGGLKGGNARAAGMTQAQRSSAARKAALCRWRRPKTRNNDK